MKLTAMNGNKRILTTALAIALVLFSPASAAFTSSASSLSSTGSKISFNQGHGAFMGQGMRLRTAPIAKKKSNRKGDVGMFLGSDGGILGVGTPEIVSSHLLLLVRHLLNQIYLCITSNSLNIRLLSH